MAIVTDGATRDGGGGGSSFPATTNLSMGGNKLTSVGTPTANEDAATKKYVDDSVPAMDHAIVKATSSQSLTAGSWAQLTWGTVIVDSNSLTGTANQFTIQTAGVYTVSLWVGFAGSNTGRLQIAISKNKAAYSNDADGLIIASSKVSRDAAEYWALNCSGTVKCIANDIIYAYGYASSNESTSDTSCADAPFLYFSIVRTA